MESPSVHAGSTGRAVVKTERCKIDDPAGEDRLEKALGEARQQLSALYARGGWPASARPRPFSKRTSFSWMTLNSSGRFRTAIQDDCINAEAAVAEMALFASQMLALEDEYFQACARISVTLAAALYRLNGISLDQLQPLRPVVILAENLPHPTPCNLTGKITGVCAPSTAVQLRIPPSWRGAWLYRPQSAYRLIYPA